MAGVSGRRTVLTTAAAAAALTPLGLATAQMAAVPRDKTMILVWSGSREGRWIDYELWNPYSIGSNHQNGANIIYEPLAYYSAFADKTHMWLAESYQFSADFRQLTIKTRPGIVWSDGVAFTAEDVAFTLNSLRDLGPKVKWGIDVRQVMKEAKASDTNTVVVDFLVPSPRFFFFMTYKYDIGIYIVPKHIFAGQDWPSFKHFDLAKGWPVTTGPWKVTEASLQQKIFDRRPDWWAVKTGLASMPAMERTIWLPSVGEQALAQALITNQIDAGFGMQPATFATVFRSNPKITTHAGQKSPYGYVDWWPISLYLNNDVKPFDDKDVRWALSHYIDRQQLIDVGYLGASQVSALPMPDYPPLRPYFTAVKDLLEKYNTLEFNSKKGDALLSGKGWKKDADGYWARDNTRLRVDIIGFGSAGPAMGPLLTEMLKRRGVEAAFSMPPDFDDRFQKGQYTGSIYGHGGAINEPYSMLRLYQGQSVAVPGAHLVNFPHWKNAEFDKITDEMFVVDPADQARMIPLFRRAMEIWLPELPDIQLVQNFHRIPMNTTYWKNWPTAENPYVNGASWHLTYPLVLWNLKPA